FNIINKKTLREMQSALYGMKFAFSVRNFYERMVDFIQPHLSNSGGSIIPEDYQRLDIVKYKPIIALDKQIKRQNKNDKQLFSLKFVGTGSYASVYRFKDDFYNQTFALKRANKDLTFTELNRFKREFEVMKKLDSPYILKVCTFKEEDNEFIMEYVDQTLQHYIDKNNSSLQFSRRSRLVLQVFSAFNYIYSRRILHRDISYSNILVKVHDDNSTVIKVSDFGYLKEPESTLTRQNTEFNGSLNARIKVCGSR
ncbi:MAG: protein kinase family protein, partial [Alkalibacterium sp.]|nr:protein kinase family protein [Alkalibacterium sp.]